MTERHFAASGMAREHCSAPTRGTSSLTSRRWWLQAGPSSHPRSGRQSAWGAARGLSSRSAELPATPENGIWSGGGASGVRPCRTPERACHVAEPLPGSCSASGRIVPRGGVQFHAGWPRAERSMGISAHSLLGSSRRPMKAIPHDPTLMMTHSSRNSFVSLRSPHLRKGTKGGEERLKATADARCSRMVDRCRCRTCVGSPGGCRVESP